MPVMGKARVATRAANQFPHRPSSTRSTWAQVWPRRDSCCTWTAMKFGELNRYASAVSGSSGLRGPTQRARSPDSEPSQTRPRAAPYALPARSLLHVAAVIYRYGRALCRVPTRSTDILYLVQVCPITFGSHIVAMDESKRR